MTIRAVPLAAPVYVDVQIIWKKIGRHPYAKEDRLLSRVKYPRHAHGVVNGAECGVRLRSSPHASLYASYVFIVGDMYFATAAASSLPTRSSVTW